MKNTLNQLNNKQREAVIDTEGAQLILAGAGSGKTKVVTTKIAYLINEKRINPQEILAFTFTNKAAKEMKERVSLLLGGSVDRMWIGTFHSICVRILRRDLNLEGYSKSFSIFDTSDQKTLIKECIRELNIDEKIYSPKYIQARISSLKNEGILPSEFEKFAISPLDKTVHRLYELYEKNMKLNNAFDFDDLIIKTIELLNNDSIIKKYYQERFRYIFVDEYQDTNNIQYQLIKIISGFHKKLCVVGDADQSIYKWRGANINNILDFEKDFVNSKKIILSQNYRSTKNILTSANEVISNNTSRIKKDLWTENIDGDKPKLYIANNNTDESIYVINEISKLLLDKVDPKEIAILYRSNAMSRSFEEQLIKNNIPYKVIGGIKFYDRAEIKDLLAYLRLVINPNDDISFRRVINSPKRGIGDVTVNKLASIGSDKNISLFDSINYIENYDGLFDARATKSLVSFKNLIDNLVLKSELIGIYELLDFLIERVEYTNVLEKQDSIEAKSKIENIEEFLNSIKEYEENDGGSLHEFLTGVSLLSDVDKTEDKDDSLSLLTVHSAKGLEFEYVFLVALEEGIFPSAYAETDEDLEEERRLMYVAITRAKKSLYLSYSKNRLKFGKNTYQIPSVFIKELNNTIEPVKSKINNKIFLPNESRSYTNTFTFKEKNNFIYNNRETSEGLYKLGQDVKHKKWGKGTITKIDISDGEELVTVMFDSGLLKTLISSLAPMEVISE